MGPFVARVAKAIVTTMLRKRFQKENKRIANLVVGEVGLMEEPLKVGDKYGCVRG